MSEWFGRRCALGSSDESGGLLLIGECRKSDVIAHFTRRDEDEIVINPDDVAIHESIRIEGEDSASVPACSEVDDE